jgi:hypothetical protein
MVLVDEPTGWRAYFCTDPTASVADILGAAADRFSLEIAFRDCKQVIGAGQQQVRFLWADVARATSACGRIRLPSHEPGAGMRRSFVDRSASSWDVWWRRPSHTDRRKAWRRELLSEGIQAVLRPGVTEAEIQAAAERLLSLRGVLTRYLWIKNP